MFNQECVFLLTVFAVRERKLHRPGNGRQADPAMMNDDNDDALRTNEGIAHKRRPKHFVAEEA